MSFRRSAGDRAGRFVTRSMSTRIGRTALALALALGWAGSALAQPLIAPGDTGAGVQRGMEQVNNSGEVGTVTLFRNGANRTLLVLDVKGAPNHAQPVHIRRGTCDHLNPLPAYPLHDLAAGRSSSVANISEDRLLSGNYSVTVEGDSAHLTHIVSCGHLYR